MPELPEVENVKASLVRQGCEGQTLAKVELRRQGLRVPFPRDLSKKLAGETIQSLSRRAKFILFETQNYYLLSHLGMTGSWRKEPYEIGEPEKHDHVRLQFQSGFWLVFNDPRRFGLLDLIRKEDLAENKWLKHLGVEPLEDEFTADHLFKLTRGVKSSIKAFIMDQRRVVGVGNIYASEALFYTGVRPTRKAAKLTRAEAGLLVESIRRVLSRAIAAGGSTIRTYRNSEGQDGRFQVSFQVYDRAGESCRVCGQTIRSKMIVGRNTFWCSQCQR